MKLQQLEEINKTLKLFMNARFETELRLVFGDGDPDSSIVLVGEAPGKNEVIQGKPFVGQAGKNLEEFIEILDIKRSDLYITNTVKFRPFKVNPSTGSEANRPPTKEEVQISTDHIRKELAIIQPKLVVSLGNVALKCILKDEKASIGVLHGKPLEVVFGETHFNLFPLYHPASIIYNRNLKTVYLEDLQQLKKYIEENRVL